MANPISRIFSQLFRNTQDIQIVAPKPTFTIQNYSPIHISIEDDALQQQKHIKPIVLPPVHAYKSLRRAVNGDFEDPEYDLAEILSAEDVESYLRIANNKKTALCFKEGWDLVGKNPTTVKYVKKRLRQISNATNISTEQLLRSTLGDLFKISNCFWALVRDIKKSGGQIRHKMDPIAGVFIIPAETVQIKTDNNGRLTRIRQHMPDGRYKPYSLQNIIHYAVDRKNGFAIGTPRSLPVLDDIRSLRRIEENVEMLIYKDLFPIYQYKVGTENRPARIYADGMTEIDVVRSQIETMPPEGIFVTPERHDISAIGAEGRALRIEGHLKHFKQRVLSGLGLSAVDVGETEGASKSSSEVVTQSLVDEVKDMQDIFEDLFNHFFIRALLIESTFSFDTTDPDNMVYLKFKEIDVATQIAMENHNAQLFSQHVINHIELRNRIGQDVSDDMWWEDSHFRLITEPLALIAAGDAAYTEAAADNINLTIDSTHISRAAAKEEKLARAKPTATTSTAPSPSRGEKSGASRDKPSNQHGKKNEPLTRTNSLAVATLRDAKQASPDLYEVFQAARYDALRYSISATNLDWYVMVLRAAQENFKQRVDKHLRRNYIAGYRNIIAEAPGAKSTMLYDNIRNHVNTRVTKIFEDITKRSVIDFTEQAVGAVFDTIEYRIHFLYRTEMNRARNYGRLVAFRELNVKSLGSLRVNATDCKDCDKMSEGELDVATLSLLNIPPYHANCSCSLIRTNPGD